MACRDEVGKTWMDCVLDIVLYLILSAIMCLWESAVLVRLMPGYVPGDMRSTTLPIVSWANPL